MYWISYILEKYFGYGVEEIKKSLISIKESYIDTNHFTDITDDNWATFIVRVNITYVNVMNYGMKDYGLDRNFAELFRLFHEDVLGADKYITMTSLRCKEINEFDPVLVNLRLSFKKIIEYKFST